jgi:hypothetical protein
MVVVVFGLRTTSSFWSFDNLLLEICNFVVEWVIVSCQPKNLILSNLLSLFRLVAQVIASGVAQCEFFKFLFKLYYLIDILFQESVHHSDLILTLLVRYSKMISCLSLLPQI